MSQTIGEAIKLAYEHEGKINDILNNYMTTDTPQTVTGAKYFPNGKAMFENYIIASGYTISFPQRNGEIALASDIDSIRANYVAWIQGLPNATYGSEIVSYVFNVYNNRNQGSQNILQNFSFTIISATDSQAGLMSAADKVKVNNITSDIATALSTAKTYTDGKTERTYLVNTIGEATTSQSGLLSAADKTKINNIAGDISTALNAAKTYTDSKIARENLVAVLGEATTTLNGLMSATDKERLNTLYALLGESGDPDQFVNTISEILEVFETYPEGADIATILAGKINYSDVVDNLNSNETVKPLSANQGRILKGMVDQKVSSYSNDSTQWDTTPTSGSTKPVTSGGVKAADDALAADITALDGRTDDLETSVSALQTNKADKADTYNKTETEALLDEKQDTLVSGENIKTLNGTSLLGSGNYDFDTALNETSTNAVQNKTITEYITDLESKVSTLAVKVYNHDVALGTLNIENVLYSVENADSFAIPTTIGTNADVVIPKSRMALSAIKGKTEYSRNLIGFDDTTETKNGVTMTIKNGVWTLNGTATQETYFYPSKSMPNTLNGTYTIYGYGNGSVTLRCTYSVDGVRQYDFFAISNAQKSKTFNGTETNFGFEIIVDNGAILNNVVVKPMLVQGSTAPTSFVPYYTGLKNVELNSLNVYGKTDNYTELRIGDEVTCLYLTDLSSVTTSLNVSINLDGVTLYISPSWKTNGYQYDKADEILAWTGSAYSETHGHAILEGGGFLYLRKPRKVTAKYGSTTAVNNVKNATSVKSILPSSILPRALASYERLEVVDNGDDTYKIDLVSHEPLINGNSYNSLWIGNPQGINAYSSIFSMKKPDDTYLLFESISSENTIYNRIRLTASDRASDNTLLTSLLSNINELALVSSPWGNIPVFGGADNYVSESTTNRNVVLKFSQSLTMNKINSSYENFDDNFRNGEETRTTLVSGLSLDDVSAVIDTGDIVYADNSNAEYDVSIAETSVELLVNKN